MVLGLVSCFVRSHGAVPQCSLFSGATIEKVVGIGAVGQTMGQVNALRCIVMESIMSPEEVSSLQISVYIRSLTDNE